MNSTSYVFLNRTSEEYSFQYPFDYSKAIIKRACCYTFAKRSYMCIHRDGALVYYIYVHPLSTGIQDKCDKIGFCVLLNDVMFTNLEKVFVAFENTLLKLINNEILFYTESGEINIFRNPDEKELNIITEELDKEFARCESDLIKLPPVKYSISIDKVKSFLYDKMKNEEMVKASGDYHFTVLEKECYSNELQNIHNEIARIKREIKNEEVMRDKLQKRYEYLLEETKQYTPKHNFKPIGEKDGGGCWGCIKNGCILIVIFFIIIYIIALFT